MRGGLEAAVWLSSFVASLVCYLALVRLDAVNGAEPVARFLALLATAFLLYAAAVAAERRLRLDARIALPLVLVGGLALRAALLPAGLPPGTSAAESLELLRDDLSGERVVYEPFLLYDSDVWRYLWDGHVWASGENPFAAPPEARADLAEDELWADVLDNVNHPSIATIYPPGAQLVFVTSHAVAPGSLLALKGVFVAFDLGAALFLAATLGRLGARPSTVILYFWNPLVIKAFAGSAHFDATLVAALAALAYFVVRGWRAPAAVSLALGLLFKLVPLVLVPFVWRRIGARATLAALGGSAVVIAAFLLHAGGTAGFGRFANEWYFNAPAYAGLRFGLSSLTPYADTVARGLATLTILGAVTWLAVRDDGEPESLPRWGALALGAPLLLGPVVMPWYVTWLLPFAVLAGQRLWLAYTAVVCLGFLVMVDGTEPSWALGAQALALTVCAWTFRRDLPMLRSRAPGRRSRPARFDESNLRPVGLQLSQGEH